MTVSPRIGTELTPLISAFGKDDADIVVSLVASAALADGKIDAAEVDALRGALEGAFGSALSLMVVKTLVGDAVSRIRAAGPDVFAKELGRSLGERALGAAGVRLGFAIARASEGVSDTERARLAVIGEGAGLSADEIAAIEAESASA